MAGQKGQAEGGAVGGNRLLCCPSFSPFSHPLICLLFSLPLPSIALLCYNFHMMQKLSRAFFNGLIILLPTLVTVWLMFFFYNFFDGILGNIITLYLGRHVPGLGLVIIVLLILLVGLISPNMIGKKLIEWGNRFMNKVPLVRNIYSSVQQVNEVLFMQKESKGFNRACLVEYPRKGIWSVGFVTSDAAKEIEKKAGWRSGKMINVFIANTPTPATGFLIIVPLKEVKMLDMKMDDAFKYLVSAGVLKPKG
jgi:uncharacterized membrane protein